jgi:hypothetical protein
MALCEGKRNGAKLTAFGQIVRAKSLKSIRPG